MGVFDFFLGRSSSKAAPHAQVPMRPENPSWILVEGSSPETIQQAVIEHSQVTSPVVPRRHAVRILQLDSGKYGVTFDPPAPPYALTNLIGWLDDPAMNRGARRAASWLVAPGDGTRFFLAPQRQNSGGDTLMGVGSDGRRVVVYLPDCSVTAANQHIAAIPEPELLLANPLITFDVTLDADPSFGNPDFQMRA